MKRIGIISDTHSCWDPRFAEHFGGCDEVWHAGDIGCVDVLRQLEETVPVVRAVRGNIDHGDVARLCPELLQWETEGLRCLMTHIGGYPGRYSPGMARLLRENRIGLMIAGHSHILRVIHDPALNCLHINPGAAGVQGWQKERTLVRLEIDAGVPKNLEVIELGKFRL